MVDAPVGQTQYTTRGIIREVEGQTNASHTKTVTPRFPTRIEFEFNSDRLTPQGKRDLDVFGAALTSKLKEKKVMLEGHTDDIGSDQYNLDLSERRAAVAKQYLLDSFGLPSEQVVAAGKGKSGSIAPNDSETDRSRNRRVDFIFTDAPTSK
jgi:outer membrane protein OmpA-like peptidoglycan-associated protein